MSDRNLMAVVILFLIVCLAVLARPAHAGIGLVCERKVIEGHVIRTCSVRPQ